MILSLHGQAKLFLLMIGLGACMGILYDALRIFRSIVPHKPSLIQIEDGMFWLVAVFLVFAAMLRASAGEVRFFSVFGLFGGMGLYFLTVSRLVLIIGSQVLYMIWRLFRLFLQILLTPLRLCWLVFGYPFRKIVGFCERKKKKLLQSCKLYAKIKKHHIRMGWKIFRHRQDDRE